MITPRLVLVNVQVTVSPGCRLMALTGLPSEQVALVRVQSVTAPSETEYVPWTRAPESFGAVASASWKVCPPLYDGVNVNSCGSPARHRRLVDDDVAALDVREGAGDGLAGLEADRLDRAAVGAGGGGQIPTGLGQLGDRVGAGLEVAGVIRGLARLSG